MSSRAAKVARVIPIDTPDNSSSDSDSETEKEGTEIQVGNDFGIHKILTL